MHCAPRPHQDMPEMQHHCRGWRGAQAAPHCCLVSLQKEADETLATNVWIEHVSGVGVPGADFGVGRAQQWSQLLPLSSLPTLAHPSAPGACLLQHSCPPEATAASPRLLWPLEPGP